MSCVSKGPVFRVSVTVLQPEPLAGLPHEPHIRLTDVLFRPSAIKRHIIVGQSSVVFITSIDSFCTNRFFSTIFELELCGFVLSYKPFLYVSVSV